jgi:hypothetical protein
MLTELAPGAPDDFDFEIGDWVVKHRRLKDRLKSCNEWEEFDGESSTHKILGGFGNLEDNLIHSPKLSYRAIALRSYNAETRKWSIWWLDGRFPDSLDTTVVGEFSNGVGLFYADEILDGIPIKIRFKWNLVKSCRPQWEQAFSNDGGATWETNWTMDFLPKAKI